MIAMIVLALMGIVFLITGIVVVKTHASAADSYERVNARVYMILPSESINAVEPVVDLVLDGKETRLKCQPVSHKKVHARSGDMVQVYVRRGKALGLNTWTVLWDTGEQAASNLERIRTIAGITFTACGIVLLVVSFVIFLTMRKF